MSFKQELSPTHEETFKCAECGTEFTRKVRAKSLTGHNHFCSRKCSRAFYHRKERKGVRFEERTAVCKHCGAEFKARIETYKSDAYLPHYCQKPECQEAKKESLGWKKYYKPGQWRKYYRPKGRKPAKAKKEPSPVVHSLTCLECGREFPWTGRASSRAKPKCCSPECRRERERELEFVYNRTVKKGRPKVGASSMTGTELRALVAELKAEKPDTFKTVCICCGKEFEYDVRHSGFGHKRKYCSKACQRKDISARVAMERDEKSNHQVTCSVCGKKFWSIYPTAKYCSKRCKHMGAHPECYLNPDGTPKVKKEVLKTCPSCGKEFRTLRISKVYCSDACRKKSYTKHQKRAQAHSFTDAKEREEDRMRRILEVRAKREAVKEDTRRLKAERAEWLKAHPEEATKAEQEAAARRAEFTERRRAKIAESAARKRAAHRERAKAEREAEIAKAKAEGRQVAGAVCEECGCDFEYVVVPGAATPRFCCSGCKDHWKWEHGGKEKAQAYMARLKAEGGRWSGRKFVKAKKKESLTVTWRGQNRYYLSGRSSFRIDDFSAVYPEQFVPEAMTPEAMTPEDVGAFDYDAYSGE